MKKLIEICCCSVDDAVEAFNGGADRIELNSALEAGGLTPTLGCLIEVKKRINIPVIVMIRPRTGGFCYTKSEFEQMKLDAKIMLENGADGVAVGILNSDKTIDINRTKYFSDLCQLHNKEIVFHRAIDITPDLIVSMQKLISIGITRILTSGGKQRCLEGISVINSMLEFSNDIQILACGSIRPTNLKEIMSKTQCTQFHMALLKEECDGSMEDSHITFNGVASEDKHKLIDIEQVKAVMNII